MLGGEPHVLRSAAQEGMTKENTNIRRQRRQDLIEATITVIAAHGYAGTTVSRVAEQAQVSAGLMNFHFSSKDLLFQAVFEYLSDEYEIVWRQCLADAGQEPLPKLRAMVAAYFDPRIFTAEKLAVWFTFWSDANLRDHYRAAATRVEEHYSKEIVAELKRYLAGQADAARQAREVAAPLIAMIDGYWLQAIIYPARFKPKAAIKDCENYLALKLGLI
jgi:TetR/AcrR family transcriptional repressor of bet genes